MVSIALILSRDRPHEEVRGGGHERGGVQVGWGRRREGWGDGVQELCTKQHVLERKFTHSLSSPVAFLRHCHPSQVQVALLPFRRCSNSTYVQSVSIIGTCTASTDTFFHTRPFLPEYEVQPRVKVGEAPAALQQETGAALKETKYAKEVLYSATVRHITHQFSCV